MYVRFVVNKIDPDSHKRVGVFHAASYLRDEGYLSRNQEEELREIREWFDENLEKPDRFTASKPPYYRKQSKAISWFKETAHDHINKVLEMAVIVESHGVRVTKLEAERVGYVVYEDEFQIVAEPFVDTIC
jgi:hypothetical protein